MSDYTEMVKRLRACAGGECRHYERIGGEPCIAPLLREAADAIERLQQEQTPKARWVRLLDRSSDLAALEYYCCTRCRMASYWPNNYCSYCGAKMTQIETDSVVTNLFDTEEVHEDCTVVIWRNSGTGEESIGWYENGGEA